ncbi:hypothetical protein [Thermus sp.]|uniref:hypothetical protein n=1 Tax=Thermus sp. TaxID=275 RepID=UPI003D100047
MTETQIRPLTQEYVRETLKGFGFKVLTDPDGDSLVILGDERRWPRAFVRKGKLHLDYHWDLEQGIHPGLLRDLLLGVIMGTGMFLLWLEEMEA